MYQGEIFGGQQNREIKKENFTQSWDKKERDFYAGKVRYGEMIDFLEKSDCAKEDEVKKKEMLLNLYKGMKKQAAVNIDAVRFMLSLGGVAKNKKKQTGQLTEEESQEAFYNFEKKDVLAENEKEAINFYEKSLENWRDTFFVKRHTVETMLCDLRYRSAKRIVDRNEKSETMTNLKRKHRNIAEDIFNKGLRAENQLVFLINEWAERNNRGHLIDVYSAMPLDDHKEKIDVQIVVGDKILNINLKAYKNSSDVAEFNENLLNKEKEKIRGSNIDIVVLGSDEIQEVWRLLGEDSLDSATRKKTTRLLNNIIKKIRDGFLLKEIKNSNEKREVGDGVSKKDLIEKHSNIPNLIKWGYLAQEGSASIDAILEAKRRFKKDIEDKNIFEKLRKDI